jgi:hypothetical protein
VAAAEKGRDIQFIGFRMLGLSDALLLARCRSG